MADALSRKSQSQLATFLTNGEHLIREFSRMQLEVVRALETGQGRITTLVMEPDLRARIVEAQRRDTLLKKIRSGMRAGERKFSRGSG